MSVHLTMWSGHLLLVLKSKYHPEKALQVSEGSVLGVLSGGRLVLPLWVGSQVLRFDANMIIFTGRGKRQPSRRW